MDYFGLIYLSVFSFFWLFGLKEDIELKIHKYFIFWSFLTGILLMASVVLTWPANISANLKRIWRYVFAFIIFSEVAITSYELKIMPEKLSQKEEMDMEIDFSFVMVVIIIDTILLSPGLYYAYKLAYL